MEIFNNFFTNCTATDTGETQKVTNQTGPNITEVVCPIILVTAK